MSRFVRTMPADEQVEFLDAVRRFMRLGPYPGSRRAALEKKAMRCPQLFADNYDLSTWRDGCRQARRVGSGT